MYSSRICSFDNALHKVDIINRELEELEVVRKKMENSAEVKIIEGRKSVKEPRRLRVVKVNILNLHSVFMPLSVNNMNNFYYSNSTDIQLYISP